MENWLSIATGVFLIAMILYGHHKGFIKLVVSAVAIIATIIIVNTIMPQVTDFLKNNTKIYDTFEENMIQALNIEEHLNMEQPAEQRDTIENLNLPKQLKNALLENNNNEVYRLLGVETFTSYIARYLANSIINTIGFLVLFVLIFAGLNIITIWLDLVARLPIISGINKLAGAVLGGVEGLVFLWIMGLLITVFAGTKGGMELIHQIESSPFLSFIYNHNLLSGVVMSVVRGIL